MRYSHRNNEKESPTVEGLYILVGVFCGHPGNYALVYNEATATVNKIDDEWEHPVSECDGQWWGPVLFGDNAP